MSGSSPVPDDDDRASQAILGALRRHRTELGGEAGSPVSDDRVSERILGEARVRSGRISGAARSTEGVSGGTRSHGRPVPRWLWVAWALAVIAVVAAWLAL